MNKYTLSKGVLSFALLLIISFNVFSQQTTFRIQYDVAIFDLPGGIVQNPSNAYVFSGTNATLGTTGHVFEISQNGNVNWSKAYSAGGLSTQFTGLKNATGGGYIVTGGTGTGCLLARLDAAGNVTWANRYRVSSSTGSSEFGNKVIQTSDGGFVVAGSVTRVDPDGAGAIARQDSSKMFCMKVNSSGTLQWMRTYFYTTAFDDDDFLYDVAEVSDGYVFVGSATIIGGDGQSDAVILKTDINGNLSWFKRWGSSNSEEANTVLNNGTNEVVISGDDNGRPFILRVNTSNPNPSITGTNSIYTATGGLGLSAGGSSLIKTIDNQFAIVGSRVGTTFSPPFLEFSNFLLKVNATNGSVIFGRNYNSGFISILPVGLQARDTGYVMNVISATIPPGVAAYDYGVVKTDKDGRQNVNSNCPEGTASFTRGNYVPTLSDVVPTTVTLSSTNSVTLAVTNINPVQNVVCRTIACIPPVQPTVSATQNNFCPGTSTTINASGGTNVTYRVYTQPSGGNAVGTTPYAVSPNLTTIYYVEADDNTNPGCVSTRASITITVLPATPAQPDVIGGEVNPCPGQQSYSIASVTNASNYNWSLSGGGTISGNGTTANINWTSSGTYTVSVTASNSCGTSAVRTLTVNVQPAAPTTVGNISGSTSACPGQQAYSIAAVNNATNYVWSVSGGGTLTSAQGTINMTIDWQTSGGPYIVLVTASNACGSANASTNVTVLSGIPNAPNAITGSNNACIGNNNYSILAVTNATTYTWSVSNGGVISGGQNTTGATIAFPSSGTYTISVTANNACGNSLPQTIVVDVINTLPSNLGSITGNDSLCFGTETYVVGAANNATSYTWTVGNAGTILSGQGTSTINVSWAATQGNYVVSVVANNVCGSSPPSTLNVYIAATIPSNPISISGNNNPCPGVAVYSIQNVNNASSYTWSLSDGGNIINGQGTNSISIEWTLAGGPYTISVIANNACGNSNAATYIVNVQQGVLLQPGEILGDTLLCPGVTTYSIANVNGAVDYTWNISSGGSIVNGQGTNVVFINWNQSGGSYTVSVTANSTCASSQVSTIQVIVQPAVPSAPNNIIGNDEICSGTELYNIVNVLNATSYNWTISGGGTITLGQGTNEITVNWNGNAGNYTLSVNAENSCGSSSNATLPITILPPAPVIASNISGNINVCPDNENYTIASVPDATSYTWSTTNGGVILNGQGTNAVGVSWLQEGVDTLSVVATNTCGSSQPKTIVVTVNPSPTNPTVNVSNTSLCLGDSAIITATNAVGGNVSYRFYDASTAGNFIDVSPLNVSPIVTTTYYLEVINEFGCRNSNTRVPTTITVVNGPNAPQIEAGSTMGCIGEMLNITATVIPPDAVITWWDAASNGNLLATGNQFTTPAIFGNTTYYIQSALSNGCANVEGRIEVPVSAIQKPVITLSTDKENNAIFPDETITITALPSGLANYEFYVNDVSVQNGELNTYSSSKFNNNDSIGVIATEMGCESEIDFIIIKQREFPNAFTPNGDNTNDVFLKGYDLVILNRWGQELYIGKDGWDGTYDGRKVSPGTYFYILTLADITDRDNVIKGTVLVIED